MIEGGPSCEALDAAVKAIAKAGNSVRLAKQVGVSRWAVHQWKATGIPAARVGRVAEITGMSVHELRPDLFPLVDASTPSPEPQAAA